GDIGAQESVERQIVVRLDEVEALLIEMSTVIEAPGILLERHDMDDIRRPGDGVAFGAQAVNEGPTQLAGLEPMPAANRLRQGRLAGADGSDDGPCFAVVCRPVEMAKGRDAAESNDGRVFEMEHVIGPCRRVWFYSRGSQLRGSG